LPLPLNRIDSRTGIVTEKINYRSVGRGDGGLLKRRKIKFERDPQVPLVSSIPTKFQTRLLKDNRENGAFTSRAPRFQLPAQSRMPGPASYVERQTFHGDERVDQRAVGVFASNTRRFRPTVCNYHIQGPAAYEVSRSEQNHGCPSAAFTEKSSVNPAKCRIQPSPGPGEYLWNDNQWSHHGPQASLAVVICREGAKPDLKIHDHAMRSPCPLAVTADMPQTDRSHRFDRSVAANTRRCLGSQTRLSEAKALEDRLLQREDDVGTPGPGDYSPHFGAIYDQHSFSMHGSSSFQSGNSCMPRKWRLESPGPGLYEPTPPESKQGAGFPSAMRKIEYDIPAAPGPAYYKPTGKEVKKSFHLNLGTAWI